MRIRVGNYYKMPVKMFLNPEYIAALRAHYKKYIEEKEHFNHMLKDAVDNLKSRVPKVSRLIKYSLMVGEKIDLYESLKEAFEKQAEKIREHADHLELQMLFEQNKLDELAHLITKNPKLYDTEIKLIIQGGKYKTFKLSENLGEKKEQFEELINKLKLQAERNKPSDESSRTKTTEMTLEDGSNLTRELESGQIDQFYENRPELPNQVSVSPKALSKVRLDQDVLAFQCLDERFTQFVMHSSLPEVKELQPAPLPIMPDSGTPHLPATPETSSALTVPHSQESRAVSTYFDISLPSIETVSNAVTTINAGRCIVHGAKQFAEYFMSTTREVFSPKVEHKYVRQLQENAAEVLKYIKKVGKDLDRKDPQNIEAFTEEAQKIERKIDGKSSFTSKQMKEMIDDLMDLYKDAKHVAKESESRTSRHLTASQNLENLAKEILQGHSR